MATASMATASVLQQSFEAKKTNYETAIQAYQTEIALVEGEENSLLGKLGAFGLVLTTRVSNLQNCVVSLPSETDFKREVAETKQKYWDLNGGIIRLQGVVQRLAESMAYLAPKNRDVSFESRLAASPELSGEIQKIDEALKRMSEDLFAKHQLLSNELRKIDTAMVTIVKVQLDNLITIAEQRAPRGVTQRFSGWWYGGDAVVIPPLSEDEVALLSGSEAPSEPVDVNTVPSSLPVDSGSVGSISSSLPLEEVIISSASLEGALPHFSSFESLPSVHPVDQEEEEGLKGVDSETKPPALVSTAPSILELPSDLSMTGISRDVLFAFMRQQKGGASNPTAAVSPTVSTSSPKPASTPVAPTRGSGKRTKKRGK